jgi:Icc protein
LKFIHLTDPHLTAAGELFDIDVCERLRRAVASINERHDDAEMVMVTGDIAHWGEPEAYDFASEIFSSLTMPWYPLAGNHDEKPAYFEGMANAPRDDNDRTCFRLETSAGVFLALDTTVHGTHAGELDDGQLAWLDQQLGATDEPAFLFMHHHPLISGLMALDRIKLKNNDALAAVLDRYPARVRHIFFGHMHRTFHGSWRGTPFSTVKSTAHQVSPRINIDEPLVSSREMPAYAVVLIDDEAVCVHDVSYLEFDTEFGYDRDDGKSTK